MNIYKIFALVSIVALCSFAVLLFFSGPPASSSGEKSRTIAPLASMSAQTRLFFSPSVIQLIPGQAQDVAIMVDSAQNTVSLAQIELKYNPQAISITSMRAGNFFPRPFFLLTEQDIIRGRVNYALRNEDEKINQGSGKMLIMTLLSPLEASASGKTAISFLPKTSVRGIRKQPILQSTEDLRIEIKNSIKLSQ